MFAEEWPLMTFTLITQLAVGSYLFFTILRSIKSKLSKEQMMNITKKGMFLIGPLMVIAFICAIFHLGTPLKAYLSIGNLDSSWLSREIIFSGLFFALWFVTFILDRKNVWNQVVGWLTSAVGLVAVFSMAKIYTNAIMPAWSDVNTHLAFFGTTIIFGVAASIITVLLSGKENISQLLPILKGISFTGLVVILIQLIYLPIYTSGLAAEGQAGMESAMLLTENYAIASVFRWALTIGGIGILGATLYRKMDASTKSKLYVAALLLVIVGEFLGRYIFYGTGVPITIS